MTPNREMRRKYLQKHKGDKRLSECPLCHAQSLFYSAPKLKPYEGTKEEFTAEDFDTVIKCEMCGGIVLENPNVTKLIRPGMYIPFTLDVFSMALKYEEKNSNDADVE